MNQLGNADEAEIDHSWSGDENGARELSGFWVGGTVLDKLLVPRPGYEIVWGRPTRKQTTSGPGDMCLEMWKLMGQKQKREGDR